MAARARLLDLLCERVLSTRAAIGAKWPTDADRRDRKWHTTGSPDWPWSLRVEALRLVGERRKMPDLIEEARPRTVQRAEDRHQHDLFRAAAVHSPPPPPPL